MGMMKFLVPPPYVLPAHVVDRAQLVSLDAVPWLSRSRQEHDLLLVQRDSSESARLLLPWHVAGFGEYLLQTAMLPERTRPYLLPLELARGSLARLREHLARLEAADQPYPDLLRHSLETASQLFIEAATSREDVESASRWAERSMQVCLEAIEASQRHLQQHSHVLEARRRGQRRTRLLVRADRLPERAESTDVVLGAFNGVMAAADWQKTEPQPQQHRWEPVDAVLDWARQHQLATGCGPLILWRRHMLPDWLYLWEDDFDSLESHVVQQVEAVVQQFADRCQLWHVVGSTNFSPAVRLSDPQRLRLAASAVDAARRIAPTSTRIVSFDQPWADYLARQHHEATPLDYAAALVRAGVGVTALGLEINLGYWPDGSARRDPLEVEHLLDLWSQLGLPLYVWLAIPSDSARDRRARMAAQPVSLRANQPSSQSQADLAEHLILHLLSHPGVEGICWAELADDRPHDFPHAGLLDARGGPKPLGGSLRALREWYTADAEA